MRFEVDALAALARIELREDEREGLARDMAEIVAFASSLPEADGTAEREPQGLCALREDEVLPFARRRELLACAPTSEGGFVRAPALAETEEAES